LNYFSKIEHFQGFLKHAMNPVMQCTANVCHLNYCATTECILVLNLMWTEVKNKH